MAPTSKAPPVYKPSPAKVTAPSVYRPNQVNAPSAQLKPANNFRLETRPAPPVYRPQQGTNSGVQPKAAGNFRLETRPAPHAYRPQQNGTAMRQISRHSPGVENRRSQPELSLGKTNPHALQLCGCSRSSSGGCGCNPMMKRQGKHLRVAAHARFARAAKSGGSWTDAHRIQGQKPAPFKPVVGPSVYFPGTQLVRETVLTKVVQPKLQIDKSCNSWKSKITRAFDQAIQDTDAALGAIAGVREGEDVYRRHFNKWFGGRKRRYAVTRTKPSRINEVEGVFQSISDYLEERVNGDETLEVECGGVECGDKTSAYSKHEEDKITFCPFGLAKGEGYLSRTIIHELTHVLHDTTDYEQDDPGDTLREKALEGARPGVRKAASSAYNYEFFVEDLPDDPELSD